MRTREELTDKLAKELDWTVLARNKNWSSLLARMAETYVKSLSDDAFRDYVMNYIGNEYVVVRLCPDEDEIEYWNNEDGWGDDRESATVFSQSEHDKLSLPVGGSWEQI